LLSTRKSTYRRNGIERRKQLMAAARRLLETRDMDDISLGDVAAEAGVPKGSAYHFYSDIKDLYGSLLSDIEGELLVILKKPIQRRPRDWFDVIDTLTERGVIYFTKNPASAQLQIGPKTPPDLKLRDRQNDVALGNIYADHIDRFFVLPEIPDRPTIFFRGIEIADLMFGLSMLEHGHITPEMAREAVRAMYAYLRCYIPENLERREDEQPMAS
jgi:AcrR family transcriptional regulator